MHNFIAGELIIDLSFYINFTFTHQPFQQHPTHISKCECAIAWQLCTIIDNVAVANCIKKSMCTIQCVYRKHLTGTTACYMLQTMAIDKRTRLLRICSQFMK